MSLASLLEQQLSHLTELQELLRQEQDCLVQGQVDSQALERLAAAKLPLLNTIQKLENTRLGAQSRLGYSDDAAGSERAVTEAGCLSLWQKRQDLAQQTAHINQLNGTLIQTRLDHNRRVLEDLRQLAGSPLYGADGQTHKSQARIQSSA